jgi:hypothetical protein
MLLMRGRGTKIPGLLNNKDADPVGGVEWSGAKNSQRWKVNELRY